MTHSLDVDQFDNLAQDLASSGRWDLVLRLARERFAHTPMCPDAHRWAGWSAVHMGDIESATRHAEVLQSREPDEASTFRLWAELHCLQGNWDEARACLEQAIARWPDNASYHLQMCRVHLQRNDGAAAAESALQALQLDPENIQARFALNLIQHQWSFQRDQLTQQLTELRSLLSDDPNNPAILAEIGQIHLLRLNQPDAAICFLEQALANRPNDERIQRLFHLARCWNRPPRLPVSSWVLEHANETFDTGCHVVNVAPTVESLEWTITASNPQTNSSIDTYAACIDANSSGWTVEAIEEMLIT